jgi:hypothetical protein
VKTGDPLSPILFLVLMPELGSRLKDVGHGIHLAGLPIPVFLYADDIALLADSAQQDALRLLEMSQRVPYDFQPEKV